MGALCPLSRHFSSSSSSGSKRLALYNLTSMANINARLHQVLLMVLDQSHVTPLSTHAHHAFIKALVDAAQQSVPVSSEE
jgi:hypothetical protein